MHYSVVIRTYSRERLAGRVVSNGIIIIIIIIIMEFLVRLLH